MVGKLSHIFLTCDLILGNHSKSHIGSYEIIDFKDLIYYNYNHPRKVSMRMKLTQKVDQFIVFENLPSTCCCL